MRQRTTRVGIQGNFTTTQLSFIHLGCARLVWQVRFTARMVQEFRCRSQLVIILLVEMRLITVHARRNYVLNVAILRRRGASSAAHLAAMGAAVASQPNSALGSVRKDTLALGLLQILFHAHSTRMHRLEV